MNLTWDLVRGVEVQATARQCLPRMIEKEEMKRRITLATAWLTSDRAGAKFVSGNQSKRPVQRGDLGLFRISRSLLGA